MSVCQNKFSVLMYHPQLLDKNTNIKFFVIYVERKEERTSELIRKYSKIIICGQICVNLNSH